jgi:hypothetical protein
VRGRREGAWLDGITASWHAGAMFVPGAQVGLENGIAVQQQVGVEESVGGVGAGRRGVMGKRKSVSGVAHELTTDVLIESLLYK